MATAPACNFWVTKGAKCTRGAVIRIGDTLLRCTTHFREIRANVSYKVLEELGVRYE